MHNKKYKAFSYLSLAVTAIYCLLNVWLYLSLRFGILYCDILEIVFPLDYYTWHIYGFFAVITLVIKCIITVKNKKSISPLFKADIILHLAFTVISLVSIYEIFILSF